MNSTTSIVTNVLKATSERAKTSTWLNGCCSFTLSKYPAKFGCHRCSRNVDVAILNCHLTTWWNITWLAGWSLLIKSYYPVKFRGYRSCGSADIRLFVFHVTKWSQGHVTWGMGFPHVVKYDGSRSYKEGLTFPIPIPIPMFTNGQSKNHFIQ